MAQVVVGLRFQKRIANARVVQILSGNKIVHELKLRTLGIAELGPGLNRETHLNQFEAQIIHQSFTL